MLELAALMVLCAYIGKAYPGIFHPHDLLHVNGAHNAELLQHFRLGFHIRAAVDEHEKALVLGHNRGERRTLDFRYPFYD